MAPSDTHHLRAELRARGQRTTPQRLAVHAALRELGRHATADEVLAVVADRVPGVSLPTVYAALELLADLGLARRVRAGRAVRYDPRTAPHHHVVCERCGAVEDVEAPVDLDAALAAARATGAAVSGAEVLVHGRCARCT